MTKDKNRLVERIDALRGAETREALCIRAKLSRDFIRKIEMRGPAASARADTLVKIANALGVSVGELTQPQISDQVGAAPRSEVRPIKRRADLPSTRDVPVYDAILSSGADGFEIVENVIDYVLRPPALAGLNGVYALYVVSDSMAPMHRPGDLCFVHPGRPCLAGDSVILQIRTDPAGPIETYIKTYMRTSGGWIVTQQYNPPKEVKYAASSVLKMHHVMTMRELFG